MQDFRVEERSYVRETKSLSASRKSMVMQERLFFRNIPLSNWIEREMVIEEGRDLDQMPKESVFSTGALGSEGRLPISKLLDELTVGKHGAPDRGALVPTHVPAFGAQ
jgi:hypothetical protein